MSDIHSMSCESMSQCESTCTKELEDQDPNADTTLEAELSGLQTAGLRYYQEVTAKKAFQ